jgi:hypothetical protein
MDPMFPIKICGTFTAVIVDLFFLHVDDRNKAFGSMTASFPENESPINLSSLSEKVVQFCSETKRLVSL